MFSTVFLPVFNEQVFLSTMSITFWVCNNTRLFITPIAAVALDDVVVVVVVGVVNSPHLPRRVRPRLVGVNCFSQSVDARRCGVRQVFGDFIGLAFQRGIGATRPAGGVAGCLF